MKISIFPLALIITLSVVNYATAKHTSKPTAKQHLVGTNINDLVREVSQQHKLTIIDKIRNLPNSQRKNAECLALSVYHEGRSLSLIAQEWIAFVAINRRNADGPFGKSLCEVINQRLPHVMIPQYSFLLQKLRKLIPREEGPWRQAQEVAYNAMTSAIQDPSHGSIYFWNLIGSRWQNWMSSGKEYYVIDTFIFMGGNR